jgi:hypothetical protein
MKWFTSFLKKMADIAPARDLPVAALRRLNPDRIDIENIRSILGSSTQRAKLVCDTAVRRGIFLRRISVICPDDSVAWTGDYGTNPPETVRCWRESEYGPEPMTMKTSELARKEYFVLSER